MYSMYGKVGLFFFPCVTGRSSPRPTHDFMRAGQVVQHLAICEAIGGLIGCCCAVDYICMCSRVPTLTCNLWNGPFFFFLSFPFPPISGLDIVWMFGWNQHRLQAVGVAVNRRCAAGEEQNNNSWTDAGCVIFAAQGV